MIFTQTKAIKDFLIRSNFNLDCLVVEKPETLNYLMIRIDLSGQSRASFSNLKSFLDVKEILPDFCFINADSFSEISENESLELFRRIKSKVKVVFFNRSENRLKDINACQFINWIRVITISDLICYDEELKSGIGIEFTGYRKIDYIESIFFNNGGKWDDALFKVTLEYPIPSNDIEGEFIWGVQSRNDMIRVIEVGNVRAVAIVDSPYWVIAKKLEMQKIPFLASYWVLPGKFLAGEIPLRSIDKSVYDKVHILKMDDKGYGEHDLLTKLKLSMLVETKIGAVINLMEISEKDHLGNLFYDYTTYLEAKKIKVHRIPIRDMDIPSPIQMMKILLLIDSYIKKDIAVYVHCWGGLGRTGTVVGCYLKWRKLDKEKGALEMITELKKNSSLADFESPQTPEQREMVMTWE